MKKIKVKDKEFILSIPSKTIQEAVRRIAEKMNSDLKNKDVLFIGILNGAFMFASDLFRMIDFKCQITFLKLASYVGSSSSGTVQQLIGLNQNITGKTVVILEDIVDTGITIENIIKQLKGYEPAEIKIATMLLKPDAYTKDIPLDYIGLEIPNDFIIGYGLDYNGYGRNYEDIFSIVK
ncbi:MAG: hypoxanthine phosphoribosyltransferase [Bacteroidia bacterium]|nr:hypoxanthine phosphoribosyltransferase [Bacteroidia bacterium]